MRKLRDLIGNLINVVSTSSPYDQIKNDFPEYFQSSGRKPRKRKMKLYHSTQILDDDILISILKYGLIQREDIPTLEDSPSHMGLFSNRDNGYIFSLDVPVNYVKVDDSGHVAINKFADKVIKIPPNVKLDDFSDSAFEQNLSGVGNGLRRLPISYFDVEDMIRVNIDQHCPGWIYTSEGKKFKSLVKLAIDLKIPSFH